MSHVVNRDVSAVGDEVRQVLRVGWRCGRIALRLDGQKRRPHGSQMSCHVDRRLPNHMVDNRFFRVSSVIDGALFVFPERFLVEGDAGTVQQTPLLYSLLE